jgi:hypothetical protein
MVTVDEMAPLLAKERVPFWASTLIACGHIGKKVQGQLFYLQMSMRFRGLSNSGCGLLSYLGLGLPRRTYDLLSDQCVLAAKQVTR